MTYEKSNKIQEIGQNVFESFGRSAEEICTGDCTSFLKKMAKLLDEAKIDYEVKATRDFALADELDGFDIIKSELSPQYSHCYLVIEGFGYDAFNPEGIEEREMEFQYKA